VLNLLSVSIESLLCVFLGHELYEPFPRLVSAGVFLKNNSARNNIQPYSQRTKNRMIQSKRRKEGGGM
jgi:hypothetical protein